jgi:hypothetical protein
VEDVKTIMAEGPNPEPSEEEFAAGGFIVLDPARGGREAAALGMTAHRGVLHPDEYVDFFTLREQVEEALGFTYAEVSAAYSDGRPTAEQRQQREKIDARMLALSRAGGNMAEFAKAVGISEKTVDRALARAREHEIVPMFKNPAVPSRLVCFKCGEPGATRRVRSHSHCPAYRLPERAYRKSTVNLCDPCYAQGFQARKGSRAYWEFRDRCVTPRGATS